MAGKASYETMRVQLVAALYDFSVLCGNVMDGATEDSRDRAVVAAANLRELAAQLDAYSTGYHEPFIAFPCPHEALAEAEALK